MSSTKRRAGGVLQPPVSLPPRKPRRTAQLRVLPRAWQVTADVPRTRADCPATRPCPHIKCEWNTWMIDGADRPGRRGEASFDRRGVLARGGARGVQLSLPASSVNVHGPLNCARDVLDRATERATTVPMAVVAEVFGLTERAAYLILARAKRKLAAVPGARELLAQMVRR